MKNIKLVALTGFALVLASCGDGSTTTTPAAKGPTLNASSMPAAKGTPGGTIIIASYTFDKPVASISGTPVYVFSGYKAGAATAQRTAPCALQAQNLVCTYTVTAADAGQAPDGITYTSTTGFQPSGAAAVGTDGSRAVLSFDSGINAGRVVIGSITF